MEMHPPREFSLGFDAIEVSHWRCNELLPEVSPVFDRTETFLVEFAPPHIILPVVSLEMRPPPVSSLSGSVLSRYRFGAVPNYYRRPP